MTSALLTDIEEFLAETGMTPSGFGWQAVSNKALVTRLRNGGRVWPDTEELVRNFMSSYRAEKQKAA